MVNPDLTDERASELFGLCEPRAVVAGSDTPFARLASRFDVRLVAAAEALDADVWVGEVESGTPFPTTSRHGDDPAIWLFSGGTTGVPKAVVQTHRSFVNTTLRYAQGTVGFTEGDVTLAVPKLFFGYATGSNLLFPFSVGASTVLYPEHPNVDLLFDLIAEHRPTILINVPTMVAKMAGHPSARDQDLSCLRFATSAGEALPPELYRSWLETFDVELLDGLGTAEMWHIFVTNRPGDVKPGTLGKPVVGFELAVRSPEGTPVPAGEVGRLWVKGDSRALGYWRDLDSTVEAFHGPWFAGGDLVRIDQQGYVEHHGRADDLLKVSGKWLAPQEVESCLLEHRAVDAAVVVGVLDDAGLINPVAFVVRAVPRDGLAQELMEWALDRLEPYKHPRKVIVVGSLPTTHLGKIDRTRLKEMAGAI